MRHQHKIEWTTDKIKNHIQVVSIEKIHKRPQTIFEMIPRQGFDVLVKKHVKLLTVSERLLFFFTAVDYSNT